MLLWRISNHPFFETIASTGKHKLTSSPFSLSTPHSPGAPYPRMLCFLTWQSAAGPRTQKQSARPASQSATTIEFSFPNVKRFGTPFGNYFGTWNKRVRLTGPDSPSKGSSPQRRWNPSRALPAYAKSGPCHGWLVGQTSKTSVFNETEWNNP